MAHFSQAQGRFRYTAPGAEGTYNDMKAEATVYYLLLPDRQNPSQPRFVVWFQGDPTKVTELRQHFNWRFGHLVSYDTEYMAWHIRCPFKELEHWAQSMGAWFTRSNETDYRARRKTFASDEEMDFDAADAAYKAGRDEGRDTSFDDFFNQAESERTEWRRGRDQRTSYGHNEWNDPRGNEAWDETGWQSRQSRGRYQNAGDHNRWKREYRNAGQDQKRHTADAGRDAYSILGVNKDAPDEVVKAAYRVLAVKNHPDKPGGSKTKMQELNGAWEAISKERRF